ncbi:hypothetical protein GCM10010182_82200 [Actinomadura cremea]|nr:hypothetical protein GCM10010182_82200 [Actinomadura cremea]
MDPEGAGLARGHRPALTGTAGAARERRTGDLVARDQEAQIAYTLMPTVEWAF